MNVRYWVELSQAERGELNPVHATWERFAGGLIMHCNGGVVCALVEHDHRGVAIRLRLAGRGDPRA